MEQLASDKSEHNPRSTMLLPHYETEVVSITPKAEPFSCRRGQITESTAEMSDGTVYPVVTAMPPKDKLRSDTAAAFTTAWLTSTKGHNRHTLMRLLDAGYPVIMLGPEGEETNRDLSVAERFKLAATTSLYKISHDMNRILDDVMPQMNIRPNEIITLGESRGAMEAPGFNVEQYSPSRRVVYGDHTAPCFARAPKLHEMPGVVAQLLKEAPELGRLALQLPFQPRGRHYASTLHKNAEYYLKEPFKIPHMLSGEAGQLAQAARFDTPLHLLLFTGDSWSQPKEWESIYSGREDWTSIEKTKGLHLSIAQDHTLHSIVARLGALAEMRGVDGAFDKVDFTVVLGLHKTLARNKGRKASIEMFKAA